MMNATNSPASTSKLNETDLSVVLEEVHDAHSQWYGIGLQLGVLEGIKKQYSKTEDNICYMKYLGTGNSCAKLGCSS